MYLEKLPNRRLEGIYYLGFTVYSNRIEVLVNDGFSKYVPEGMNIPPGSIWLLAFREFLLSDSGGEIDFDGLEATKEGVDMKIDEKIALLVDYTGCRIIFLFETDENSSLRKCVGEFIENFFTIHQKFPHKFH